MRNPLHAVAAARVRESPPGTATSSVSHYRAVEDERPVLELRHAPAQEPAGADLVADRGHIVGLDEAARQAGTEPWQDGSCRRYASRRTSPDGRGRGAAAHELGGKATASGVRRAFKAGAFGGRLHSPVDLVRAQRDDALARAGRRRVRSRSITRAKAETRTGGPRGGRRSSCWRPARARASVRRAPSASCHPRLAPRNASPARRLGPSPPLHDLASQNSAALRSAAQAPRAAISEWRRPAQNARAMIATSRRPRLAGRRAAFPVPARSAAAGRQPPSARAPSGG